MRIGSLAPALALVFALTVPLLTASAADKQAHCVGSDTCQECHWEQYNLWQASGHP